MMDYYSKEESKRIIDGMKKLSKEVRQLAKKDKNAAISLLRKRGLIVKRDGETGKVSASVKRLDREKTVSDYFAELEEKSHKRAMETMREILKSRNKDV